MFLRILIFIGTILLCNVYRVTTENVQNNGTSVYIQKRNVAEHTIEAQHETNPVIERSSHGHYEPKSTFHGFWKKKFVWRPRWVKTWQEKKVYAAVWKRMWSPALLKEWIPIPKPPPGWVKHGYTRGHGAVYIKGHHF